MTVEQEQELALMQMYQNHLYDEMSTLGIIKDLTSGSKFLAGDDTRSTTLNEEAVKPTEYFVTNLIH